jgi:hypothetical protein
MLRGISATMMTPRKTVTPVKEKSAADPGKLLLCPGLFYSGLGSAGDVCSEFRGDFWSE